VNFNGIEYKVSGNLRPYCEEFLARASELFEVVVFTASQRAYADKLLNIIDPQKKYIRHRLFRESCVFVGGNYLKDLSVLGRDLAQTIIVDNAPQAFAYQIANGVPIESWYDNKDDCELLKVLEFLDSITGLRDVRPFVLDHFKVHERVRMAQQKYGLGS